MTLGPLIVAIDGPSGVGKSTTARRLAKRLGIPYLDTGAMYRALGLLALERGVDPDDRTEVAELMNRAQVSLQLDVDGQARVLLDGEPVEGRIRSPEVGAATSRLAVHPEVRARMVELQRALAARHGGVIEGRDIGTHVVPDTPHKFYLDADPDVRVRRRHAELAGMGRAVDESSVAREIAERDARDRGRADSPLVLTGEHRHVDTSRASPDELVEAMIRWIRSDSR